MGDVLTLIEQAEKAFDADQAASMANRLMTGEGFTLEDFIEQLGMLRKLGPLKNILGMMPGAAKNKALLKQVNDKDVDRAEAIVRSMTPAERRTPRSSTARGGCGSPRAPVSPSARSPSWSRTSSRASGR